MASVRENMDKFYAMAREGIVLRGLLRRHVDGSSQFAVHIFKSWTFPTADGEKFIHLEASFHSNRESVGVGSPRCSMLTPDQFLARLDERELWTSPSPTIFVEEVWRDEYGDITAACSPPRLIRQTNVRVYVPMLAIMTHFFGYVAYASDSFNLPFDVVDSIFGSLRNFILRNRPEVLSVIDLF